MTEGAGRDDSRGNEMEQPPRWTIRACNNGRRRMEEGMKAQEAILYSDNRMLASTNPGWIQTAFDTMTGLFERVGLKTNIHKL